MENGNGNGYERHAMSFAYGAALTMDTGLGLLVDSIKHGFDESQPIVRYEGAILDGWNRYQASKIAEVTPAFVDFEGTEEEAINFVLQHNSARRQMTKIQQAYAIRKMDLLLPKRKQRTSRPRLPSRPAQARPRSRRPSRCTRSTRTAPNASPMGEEPAQEAEQNVGYTNPSQDSRRRTDVQQREDNQVGARRDGCSAGVQGEGH